MRGRNGNYIENPDRYNQAIQARIKANARQSRVRKFHEATPDWEAIQNFIYSKRGNFFDSLANSLNEWGALSIKQVEAVRKIMAQDAAKKAEWAARDASSQWIGIVGDKITVEAVVESQKWCEGDFGGYFSTKFRTAEGNIVIHFGSITSLGKGDKVKVTGKVKALKERDGVQSTQISRPKVVVLEEAPQKAEEAQKDEEREAA
jgi:hypothetical protein